MPSRTMTARCEGVSPSPLPFVPLFLFRSCGMLGILGAGVLLPASISVAWEFALDAQLGIGSGLSLLASLRPAALPGTHPSARCH